MTKEEGIRFYSPTEFSELVDVHKNTIRELCRKGEIPSLKIGGQYRIPSSYLVPTPPHHGQDDDE